MDYELLVKIKELKKNPLTQEIIDENFTDAEKAALLSSFDEDIKGFCKLLNTNKIYLASETIDKKIENLGVKDVASGLPKFWHDVRSNAIVLATTGKAVKIGADKVDLYPSQRDSIRTYYGNNAKNRRTQLELINGLLEEKELEEIDIPDNEAIIYAISGEDWIITVDHYGKIETYIMSNSLRKEEVQKEVKEALIIVQEYLKNTTIDEIMNMGGISHD